MSDRRLMDIQEQELRKEFESEYGDRDGIQCFFAPGRVNLIGEHIDYNGGFVFPAALSIGIYGAMSPREDNLIRLRSRNTEGEISIDLQKPIAYDEKSGWGNYPRGIIKYLMEEGYRLRGCDILFMSTLPDAAGLSSSAALEVLTACMVLHCAGCEIPDRVWLSRFCQGVENDFMGINCGIMDQFSVAMGKKDNAILLDCNTLEYRYIPFRLEEYSLIIMNTNKKRGLADSKYNKRREECDCALEILRKYRPIKNLCQAGLEEANARLEDETLRKRAAHVITENQRVLEAVEVLRRGEMEAFGRLMTASHESLSRDYEVTGFELDTLVQEALSAEGCIGARMTGAGFGGCAIALVRNGSIAAFISTTARGYRDKTGLVPTFYISSVWDGAGPIA